MGAEQRLKSSALPQVLALLVAACGGRYSSTGDSDGAGVAGKSTSPPDDNDPPDGVSMPPSQGGASTGRGGGSASGGVPVGMAGTGVGIGGSPVGTAGTNAGTPVTDLEVCHAYCDAFTAACPANAPGSCSKMCFSDLSTSSPVCYGPRLRGYACLTGAFAQAASCEDSLVTGFKLCGSDDGYPPACDDGRCEAGTFGDASGCHALATCQNGTADLHCTGTGDSPVCTCLINGTPIFKLTTDFTSSKAACIDDELRRLCMQQLP